jgi:hypothetical protein
MQLYTLDPILDGRWDKLVGSHPGASVFHQTGWLRALARSYGYRPVVLTSTPPEEPLSNGIVFCEVKSWITRSRLVSLPFADHAEPLLSETEDPFAFTKWMETECRLRGWRYVEIRPLSAGWQSGNGLTASHSYWWHTLDLTPSLERIRSNLHKNCIQRRIRRAEREHLLYEKGCSKELVDDFYRLLMITRRRHHLLPQPRAWFRNLVACMSPNAEIRLARKGGVPIAAILSLKHRRTVVYKYGCSDEKFHHLAGMPFLFWKLIEESKDAGAEQIDFGRTDLENDGLIRFKDQFGTTRKLITYFRFSPNVSEPNTVASYLPRMQTILPMLPDSLFALAGRFVYRHIA